MIINKKTLFKATIAGITLFTVYRVTKTYEEKKYTEVSTPDHPTTEKTEKKEESIVNKIKNSKVAKKIKRASEKVSEWIIKHEDDIDLATKCFSLIASIFTLRSSIIRSNQISPLNPLASSIKALEESNKEGERILQEFSKPMEAVILPTIEVKNGDTLVGEWAEDGSNIHFSVC